MKPLHQGNWAWHGMAWVLKTSIRFIDISTCFRIRPKFYVDTILGINYTKQMSEMWDIVGTGIPGTSSMFSVMPKMWEMCKILFFGGNAMIDTIYSIYLTQWEQLSKSLFFVWPTRVFIDGTASSWEVLYKTQFFTSLWNKKAWRLEPRRRGRVSWSEVWFSPCQLSFGRHHHHQHSSKPVSLHHQLHLHHRHHQQQHHRLKGCD